MSTYAEWNALFQKPEPDPVNADLFLDIKCDNDIKPYVINGQLTRESLDKINFQIPLPKLLISPERPIYYDVPKFMSQVPWVDKKPKPSSSVGLNADLLAVLEKYKGYFILQEYFSTQVVVEVVSDTIINMSYYGFLQPYKDIQELASAFDVSNAIESMIIPKGNIGDMKFGFRNNYGRKYKLNLNLNISWAIKQKQNPLTPLTIDWITFGLDGATAARIEFNDNLLKKIKDNYINKVKSIILERFNSESIKNSFQNKIALLDVSFKGQNPLDPGKRCEEPKYILASKSVGRKIHLDFFFNPKPLNLTNYKATLLWYPPNPNNPPIGWAGAGIRPPSPQGGVGGLEWYEGIGF